RRWEGVIASRRGDVFFSLHILGEEEEEEPVYVSEVVEKAVNPDFQHFDLPQENKVGRCDEVAVKVFCDYGEGWVLLLEARIWLGGLRYLGKGLENWREPLPPNCVVMWLSDGCYATLWDKEPEEPPPLLVEGEEKGNITMTTSSYDVLMKLNTLSECIQDAVATGAQLTSQISSILNQHSAAITIPRAVAQATEHKSTVDAAIASERKRLEASQRKLAELKASLSSRREAMATGRDTQTVGERYLEDNLPLLSRCKTTLSSTREAISAQQQRIVATLMEIFPITPSPSGEALSFHIRGLHLPSTNHENEDPATIAAALGHVAHLIYLLSYYLATPLRYPVKPVGSRSFVRDDISVIQGARTFPLWIKGVLYYRFEYAVFLINKDVQQLMSAVGLHCVDIRHTLANLKSLGLFIASGG
ncbi:UV radiation resistance protein and autophagy-related subunit 14-domain-containing protein, partial [Sphaerosporella brunnea]